ncbi:ABC transporter ATP-binding protein [Staphylococcus sp. IVB6181]|uniref:ABC transporter ATP-binding protein n=1 Tax=Staphylococcus sp. IVB6181 TaxID=2929481 RepID=UPI0021D128A1|nr:ABC transporter ATP-binding protein [Staphylococcus sp. IVB6181]UXV34130.1 ABC transporter ATP-binding protein [Staphylococcus sp. IVB6181]
MSFIKIQKLTKKFKDKTVLHGLDLNIQEGSMTTLLGPSGCGKSTLLRSIAGLHDVDSGEIFINDKRIDKLEPKARNIGMVFQHYALFSNLTVEDNISFGLKIKKLSASEIKNKVFEMIRITGLSGFEKRYPAQLSGGQQQRVALARALVMDPKVLLLDEPLSALDAQIRKTLRTLLKDIQQRLNITMILVTHDQEEAMSMSDYVYILKDGHIVQEGEPQTIYRSPNNEFVSKFIGSYNVIEAEKWQGITGQKPEQGHFVAIRPETLSFTPTENAIELSGCVKNMTMLGSIIRFVIDVNGESIIVDELNRSSNFKEINQTYPLFIGKEDLIFVD